jgi:hypothetical protein
MFLAMLIAAVLVGATVSFHAAGLSQALQWLRKSHASLPTQTWPVAWVLIRATWLLILVHSAEIMIWALVYLKEGCLPDIESAFYYSGVTYTTIGYGDLVLQKPWRILGPVEGLTGILMCGLSGAFFFVLANRIYLTRLDAERND